MRVYIVTQVYSQFVDDYEPTKLDKFETKMNYQGQEVDVQITDTAGAVLNVVLKIDW